MACRNVNKGTHAAADIKKSVRNANLKVMQLDLSQLSSVRKFAQEVCEQEESIDILINNAGIMFYPKETTVDGFEMHMAVNHLGIVLIHY